MLLQKSVLNTFNVRIIGQGTRPLLFAHGLACSQNVWKFLFPAFEAEYKIVLFDYIGSGKSDISAYNKERHSSLEGYADDILDICEELDLRDVIFVGHSVSSMIGLLAAIKNPGVFSKLIMIGPSPCYLNEPAYSGGFNRDELQNMLSMMHDNYLQWAMYFSPIAMGNKDKPELNQSLLEIFCEANPDITCDFAKVTFLSDNRKDLNKLTVPTLILQPADDIIAPKYVGEYLNKHILNSTLYYMHATGHFPHLSAVKETIFLMSQYLKRDENRKEQ